MGPEANRSEPGGTPTHGRTVQLWVEKYCATMRVIVKYLPGETTLNQGMCLGALAALEEEGNSSITLTALVEKTGLGRSAVCRAMQKWLDVGYVTQSVDPADARKKPFRGTAAGRRARVDFCRDFQAYMHEFHRGADKEDGLWDEIP